MSDIGPELPPHLLAKRKRKQEEESENASAADSGANLSTTKQSDGEKRRRVAGPAMPPAPLEERPTAPPNPQSDSESDDDDDFGPALPSSRDYEDSVNDTHGNNTSDTAEAVPGVLEEKVRRDEWMMMPPKQDDLAARMDPTKQRARGFNTGKSVAMTGASEDDSSTWHETPEQKQKRLADEMMGVSKPSGIGPQKTPRDSDSISTARKVKDHTEKTRGPSLMDQHVHSKGKEVEDDDPSKRAFDREDDDPSKRAFDREKDMSTGMRVGHAQRKEMLNKAANFSSKFSGGSYL